MNKTLIVGCGGLGGYVIEELARLNISDLILFDGDNFSTSNLNRQLNSSKSNIGKNKASIAKKHVEEISNINVEAYEKMFTSEDKDILNNVNLVIDCVDNIETRLLLEKLCTNKRLPLVSAGISKEFGQAFISYPDDNNVTKVFKNAADKKLPQLSYAVAVLASIETSLAYKVLTNNDQNLKNKLILVDLENYEINKVNL